MWWRRLNGEAVAEAVAMAVGAVFAILAVPLFSKAAHHDVGPGLFPLLAAAAVIVCAVLGLVVIGLSRRWLLPGRPVTPASGTATGAEATGAGEAPATREVRVLWLAVAVAAYIVGAQWLGFTLATLGFVTFACRLFGARSWVRIGAVSMGVAVLTYFVFVRGLEVALPPGILGF